MSESLARGAVEPLPEVGEGCVRRFDPQVMTDELGSDFAQARALWLAVQAENIQAAEARVLAEPAKPLKPVCGVALNPTSSAKETGL